MSAYTLLKEFGKFAHADIHLWIIAVAAMAGIIIDFTTVSFQAIKAALTSPVKSLRTDRSRYLDNQFPE